MIYCVYKQLMVNGILAYIYPQEREGKMGDYLNECLEKIEEFQGMTINEVIQMQMPFIIKTISKATSRYVSLENSEELSIGLLGFTEAIERYDKGRGTFFSFAQLVITGRVYNYLRKEKKHLKVVSIDALEEKGIRLDDYYTEPIYEQNILAEEIAILKGEINKFGFDFVTLVKESPKHKDTRERAIAISQKASQTEEVLQKMYEKLRLPIKLICRICSVTEKIIVKSKCFIISIIIVFYRNLRAVKAWIEG